MAAPPTAHYPPAHVPRSQSLEAEPRATRAARRNQREPIDRDEEGGEVRSRYCARGKEPRAALLITEQCRRAARRGSTRARVAEA